MITGALKSQVDQVWNAFWSGGVANPLTVIEQITYLLFTKRLDELHTVREALSAPVALLALTGVAVSNDISALAMGTMQDLDDHGSPSRAG